MARYEWDEGKRRANLVKHGLDFADVEEAFDWASALLFDDVALDFEVRIQAFGFLGSRVVVMIYTERNDGIRIISLRKATRPERARRRDGTPVDPEAFARAMLSTLKDGLVASNVSNGKIKNTLRHVEAALAEIDEG